MACASAFDTIEILVYPLQWKEFGDQYTASQGTTTHSSAPSSVTSIVGYCSTSPKLRFEDTINSFDWNPARLDEWKRLNGDRCTTSWNKNAILVHFCTLSNDPLHDVGHGRPCTMKYQERINESVNISEHLHTRPYPYHLVHLPQGDCKRS